LKALLARVRACSVATGALGALCALTTLAGCAAEFDHTEITNVKGSQPFPGTVTYARIVVPVGMVVTAHIVSYDSDHKSMDMGLQSKDTSVVEVEPVVSANDYAFFGLTPGSTDVELTASGRVVLIVTAVVTDQPSLP
jgi:hypothetical protein